MMMVQLLYAPHLPSVSHTVFSVAGTLQEWKT
jgi:hypothetical protein